MIKNSNMKTAAAMAIKDINDYLDDNKLRITTGKDNKEVWYVGTTRIYTKEQRLLNNELGVSKINYFNNTNGSDKKTD